jgi:Tfp pilus assembly protein FimT
MTGGVEWRKRRAGPAAGYSLTELLVVFMILTIFLLVAVPNITSSYEKYLLRTNASGLAAYLKLGRMKAVANNVTYAGELDPDTDIRLQCPGQRDPAERQVVVVYREPPTGAPKRAEDCFSMTRGISAQSVAGTPNQVVGFKPNGMAEESSPYLAPNWFLVKSRNGRSCQLVCVNVMGAVYVNPVTTECSSAPYGASDATPCPPPS